MQGWRRLLAAGGAALLAYVVSAGCVLWLLNERRHAGGLFELVADCVAEVLTAAFGGGIAWYALIMCFLLPPMLLSLATFAWLTRRRRGDEFLHCLRCGHILKGLSEPRCPECGEPI